MGKDIAETIKRADRFKVILIGEGILVGFFAGFVVLLYRVALEFAGEWMKAIVGFASQNALSMAVWFAALALMACIVAALIRFDPMIAGSGIPQVEGEVAGMLEHKWWRVIIAKFAGGFLCMLGGLALGREGPSIQLERWPAKAFRKRWTGARQKRIS